MTAFSFFHAEIRKTAFFLPLLALLSCGVDDHTVSKTEATQITKFDEQDVRNRPDYILGILYHEERDFKRELILFSEEEKCAEVLALLDRRIAQISKLGVVVNNALQRGNLYKSLKYNELFLHLHSELKGMEHRKTVMKQDCQKAE